MIVKYTETEERDNRVFTLLLHSALTKVLNELKESDYPNVYTRVASINLIDIFYDYTKYCRQFEMMFQNDDRKFSEFDRMLCFAMALEHNPVISFTSIKNKSPQRVRNLNEKVMTEFVLMMMQQSNYRLRNADIKGDFNLNGFDDGHKKEFKVLKDLLIQEIGDVTHNYNECLALLIKIYVKGVIYLNGLDKELENLVANNLVVRIPANPRNIVVPVENTFNDYKRSLRNMK